MLWTVLPALTLSLVVLQTRPSFAIDSGLGDVGDAPQAPAALTTPAESTDTVTDSSADRGAAASSAVYVDVQSRAQVAMLYHSAYEPSSEVPLTWNGNQADCTVGNTNAEYRAALLQRINYFRNMAGVPAGLVFSDDMNAKAQQAALMMSANGQLSHSPPSSWRCYNTDGATAAGKSNLALGYFGVSAIDGYMQDPGNGNGPVGHRRWLLYPQTQQIGTGDVTPVGSYRPTNALWVIDSHYGSSRPTTRDGFVAWPPPGYVPYQVVYSRWSFSYPGADFSAASVTLTQDGKVVAVTKEAGATGYGENTIVWTIGGMSTYDQWPLPSRDTPYQVRVSNVRLAGQPQEFVYTVTVFDPVNGAPSDVSIQQAPLNDGMSVGATIGTFVVVDPDVGDSATITLVSGEGDIDNGRFRIAGNTILLNTALTAPVKPFYYIRVQVMDSTGNTLVRSLVIMGQPLQIFLAQLLR